MERGHLSVLRDFGYDVRHIPTYTSRSCARAALLFLGSLAAIVLMWRRPSIGHLHISQRGSVVRGLIVGSLLRLRSVPLVITIHGSGFRGFAAGHPQLVRLLLKKATVVTVLSEATARTVRGLHPDVDVRLIPNAVRPSACELDPADSRKVLFAGELSRRKGLDQLLAAWRDLPQEVIGAELLVAGPVGDVAVTDRPGVRYLGVLDPSEVAERICRSRLAVLPSRAEAMPMFLLESMAAGRPVITTAIEDLRVVVGSGGKLVDAEDVGQLRDALRSALVDDDWVRTAGVEARRRIEDEYSLEHVGQSLRRLYDEVVHER